MRLDSLDKDSDNKDSDTDTNAQTNTTNACRRNYYVNKYRKHNKLSMFSIDITAQENKSD